MAIHNMVIERFIGLDQSTDESMIASGCTAEAINFDTDGGSLSVCRGFEPVCTYPIPGSEPVQRLYVFKQPAKDILIAITGGVVYAYAGGSGGWQSIYDYGVSGVNQHYCCVTAQIGTEDYLLIADGSSQIIKYDGESVTLFGSAEGCSDIACNYIDMYRGRLFAAGDSEHPNRLYYSMLPGDDRSIENWGYYPASPSVEGGHVEIGETCGDPITGVYAMSNQLLIFKRNSLYRLLGDRPGNFTVERMAGECERTASAAVCVHNDVVYYLTKHGLHSFNGVEAAPMPDMRRIRRLMEGASITQSRMTFAGDKLYFSVTTGGRSRLIVYDLTERKYLAYGGFTVYDLGMTEDAPLIVSGTRRVCEWGRGGSFDGAAIEASWRTPLTDLGDGSTVKTLRQLYLRGEGSGDVTVKTRVGGVTDSYRAALPETYDGVVELPLKNEGRTLCITFENRDGGAFTLACGVQLEISVRRRTE